MQGNNHGPLGEPDLEYLGVFGNPSGPGVEMIFVQKSLTSLDEELDALQTDLSDVALGVRIALLWFRDGGLEPSKLLACKVSKDA